MSEKEINIFTNYLNIEHQGGFNYDEFIEKISFLNQSLRKKDTWKISKA